MIMLTLLPTGTIRTIFRGPVTLPKKSFNPLSIPDDPRQCVHVWLEEEIGGLTCHRCTADAIIKDGLSHGFLCANHQWPRAIVKPPYRDYDQEVVDGIIRHEARALAGAERVQVKVAEPYLERESDMDSITFLKD